MLPRTLSPARCTGTLVEPHGFVLQDLERGLNIKREDTKQNSGRNGIVKSRLKKLCRYANMEIWSHRQDPPGLGFCADQQVE